MNKNFVAALIDLLPEPVLVLSADIRLLACNSAAQQLFPALKLNDLLARALRTPDVLDCITRVCNGGAGETTTLKERVPMERVFDVTIAPLDQPDSERIVMVSLRDLTGARLVERTRADFVANASHELRTPLASLLGFVETLQGPAREDPAARDRFLVIMREQAQRMARLVDDLLSLSRIEQNQHLWPQDNVDLTAIVAHVTDTLSPVAQEYGTTFSLSLPPSLMVRGDWDELVRVAENLIENAIKYGSTPLPESKPEDGVKPVEITLTHTGKDALLAVRDHGPGIAPEHLPRLTERFYRVDIGKSRAKGGTGLGLAIVKHIVNRHRGRLKIISTRGHGATFSVSLPVVETK